LLIELPVAFIKFESDQQLKQGFQKIRKVIWVCNLSSNYPLSPNAKQLAVPEAVTTGAGTTSMHRAEASGHRG
jgi:hypothetical protein